MAAADTSQLSRGSVAAETRVMREAKTSGSTSHAGSSALKPTVALTTFASSTADVARSAPVVIVQDTLEMLREFERAGFDSKQAESIVRIVLATVKSSTLPLCSRADLDKHVLLQQADLRQFQHDLSSKQREGALASKHMTDMVNSDFEKMRVELRYTHDKVTNSQRLDMSLERGRIRDDLLAQNAMMGQIEKRLDREMQTMQATHSNEMQIMKMTIEAAKNTSSNEIQNMRTTIEVAKSDTLKYGIGAVLSAVGLGLGVARFLG